MENPNENNLDIIDKGLIAFKASIILLILATIGTKIHSCLTDPSTKTTEDTMITL